jgi:hypothetical protein
VIASVAGSGRKLRNLVSGELRPLTAAPQNDRGPRLPPRSEVTLTIPPHSYEVYAVE